MEDYEKESYQFISITAIVLLSVFLINFLSFDNSKLRHVEMEPFSEPIQEEITEDLTFAKKIDGNKVVITPLANYKLYGRVYAKHYRPSKLYGASVEPYDISIIFGAGKEKEVYKAISVKMASTVSYMSYSGKAWEKHLSKYFDSDTELIHCFTNNHICPANKNVRKGIKKLKKKDIVYLEGYLIKYTNFKKDGSIEKGISSTSRNEKEDMMGDNGNGSCEQIYVTRVVSRHGDFR